MSFMQEHLQSDMFDVVTRLTRRLPLVEQELLTLLEHLSAPPVFSEGSCYSIFSFVCMFCRSLFVLFPLAIVLSVLLRFTDSDYPFGIFKLFLINLSNKSTRYLPYKLLPLTKW
jgi:hypothetical protein